MPPAMPAMRQPSEGSPAARRTKVGGFTLLEIIIVAFILALVAGTVVVNITPPQRDNDVKTAAVVFKEKMNHARQMALIRNWVLGVVVDDHNYAFYRWTDGQWQALSDPPFQPTEFFDIQLELVLGDFAILDNIIDGDRSAVFRSDQDDRDREDRVEPRLLVFESSDFVPFSLALRDPFSGLEYWVDGRDGLHLEVGDEPL